MVKFILLVLATTIATGCGVGLKTIQAPNGAYYYQSKCNMSSDNCIEEAQRACYEVNGRFITINSESHGGGMLADFLPGPVIWYTLTFLCGGNDYNFPQFAFHGPVCSIINNNVVCSN